jgi:hypothetical protein
VVYDSTNNRIILFGGTDNGANFNDVWALSTANGLGGTPVWSQLSTNGTSPAARSNQTAIYDNINNRMTIFAGYGGGFLNDVWVLSTANGIGGIPSWTQTTVTGSSPGTRDYPSAVYDTTNNLMIIFGGYNGTFYNDVWVLSTANGLGTSSWTQLTAAADPVYGVPTSRYGQSAVYDSANNRMIIFGGLNGIYLDDVWVLSSANGIGGTPVWSQLSTAGTPPFERAYQSAVYDATNNQMIIFGGDWYGGRLNDVWVLNHANGLGGIPTWLEIPIAGNLPAGRDSQAAAYDANNNLLMIVDGKDNDGNALADEWVLGNLNSAPPPSLVNIPSLKLFINQSFDPAFDLSEYNTGGVGANYSIPFSFFTLSTLTGSTVYQAEYGSAAIGVNTYQADNIYGSSTGRNKVKYSTYKIYKLPHVGLTPGSSWDVNVGSYTYNTSGLALPPSFGNPTALTVSNLSYVTAYWVNDSVVRITSLQSFTGAVDVDVTAAPLVPAELDQDKESIYVYSNLLPNSAFSTANDTTAWSPMEIPPGRTVMAEQQWIPNYTDSGGTQANGVWQFTFANASSGVKATPGVSNWINITNGQWYTYRIRLVADTPNNSHQSLLFGYTNYPGIGTQTDIVGNVLFGVPTVWTWQEAPLLAHGSSTTGYPQFQFKAGGAGSIYVDEVQIINATPALLDARSNPQFHYLYGQFTTDNDTTGWGQQLYFGAGNAPAISVNNGLVLNFSGASSGSGQLGIKWTANNGVQGPNHAYTFPTPNLNYDMNMGLTLSIQSGTFNSLGIVLVAAYGVQTSGQQDIGTPPSNLIAAAGVGTLIAGDYYAEGNVINSYYQGQFGLRSDEDGILVVNDVDVATDNDDPNYGDASLYPIFS